MPVSKRYSVDWGSTGMVGILTWQVKGPAGTFGAPNTAGIAASAVTGKRYYVDISVSEEMEGAEVVFSDGTHEEAVRIDAAQQVDPATRRFSIDWELPGMVGVLAYTVTGPAGTPVPRTTANVQVSSGDPTRYYVDLFVTSLMLGAEIVWDDAIDEVAEPIDSGNTIVDVDQGVGIPTTRKLWFRLKTGTPPAYTDPTGNVVTLRDPTQSFGIRRRDTGAVVLGVAPPPLPATFTRLSTGVYFYDVTETGLAYEYGAEWTNPATSVTESALLTSLAPSSYYATTEDIYEELGEENALIHGNLSSSGAFEDSPAMIVDSLMQGALRVSRFLKRHSPPPLMFPVTSTLAEETADFRLAARKYAAGFLFNKRDRQSRSGSSATDASLGDRLIADGDEILQALIDGGLVGVELYETDNDVDLNDVAPVSVGATVDACGCPVQATVCYPRYYVGGTLVP